MKTSKGVFEKLREFEQDFKELEDRLLAFEHKIERLLDIERNHLIRVKNNEELTDDFLHNARSYQDLSPEKAWKLYKNPNFDFILVDVSSAGVPSHRRLPEAVHIPWEEFKERFFEIQTKTTPLLFISEDGSTSVLACEFMSKRGYFNCSNISGGYQFWKGFQLTEMADESA